MTAEHRNGDDRKPPPFPNFQKIAACGVGDCSQAAIFFCHLGDKPRLYLCFIKPIIYAHITLSPKDIARAVAQ